MLKEWQRQSAADLGRGIAAGRIDPVELTEAFLEAASASDLTPRIYARLTEGRARAEAEAALKRARADTPLGPLDGVPVSWKDLFDTAGVATEAGSRLLEGRVPEADAEVLARGTAAGLTCLGKTHMSELAFAGLGYNPMAGSPPCVNDAGAVSGGSSSGAAASVAFGLAAAAVGSDTGGSVRIPAAWNDLVGLKPAHNALPLTGVVPLATRFDTIGPLTRSVEDAALMFAALGGGAAPDLGGASLSGARLGVLETVALDDLEEAPGLAHEAALARFAAAGAQLVPVQVPALVDAMALSAVLYTAEAYAIWGEAIERDPNAMFFQVRERFRAGAAFSAVEYIRAWRALEGYRAEWAAATEGVDAVIVPTAAILPPQMARVAEDHAYYVERNLMTLRNTRIGNLMGLCALTLPTGTPSCGISLMGAPGEETALLRLGAGAEAVLA